MTNDDRKSRSKHEVREKFNLEERTAQFGEAIIAFAKRVPAHAVTMPLVGQLVRSGSSVGANYCEADDAESKKDFRHKIWTLPEGGEGNEILAADDRLGRAGIERRRPKALAGGQGVEFDIRRDPPSECHMTSDFVILISDLIRHSGFGIRVWSL